MTSDASIETQGLCRDFEVRIFRHYYESGSEHAGVFLYNLWLKLTGERMVIRALKDLDIIVRSGTFTFLLGPNGSGKTTLLRILATFLLPTSGRAWVMGYDVVEDRREVLEVVNYIPSLLAASAWAKANLTVRANLELMARIMGIPREKVDEGIAVAMLEDIQGVPVGALSTGQQARLVIALGVMRETPVYLLDEPTIGLSPDAARSVLDHLKRLTKEKGITMFYATHQLREAEKLGDYVIFLNEGRKIADGRPEDLVKLVRRFDVVMVRLRSFYGDPKGMIDPQAVRFFEVEEVDPASGRYELRVGVDSAEEFLLRFLKGSVGRAKIERVEIKRPDLEDAFIYLAGKGREDVGKG